MAINMTTIRSVRTTRSDGEVVTYPWDSSLWYLIGDDQPFLDFLVVGYALAPIKKGSGNLQPLDEESPEEGARWIRWNLGASISSERVFGETRLELKVPSDTCLQAYVVPAKLIDIADVLRMASEIEAEVGIRVVWDDETTAANRAWSTTTQAVSARVRDLIEKVEEEFAAALQVRQAPFHELGPNARRGVPLPENALVSHWANSRRQQLQGADERLKEQLTELGEQSIQHAPPARHKDIEKDIHRLRELRERMRDLASRVTRVIVLAELSTAVYPTPLFQRDYRLRKLLRAFGPPAEEAISPIEAARSQYPPVTLNKLWELWGAVWLVKQIRKVGFTGHVERKGEDASLSLSWQLKRDRAVLELDYEPATLLVNHDLLPPAHQRSQPALEWTVAQQPPPNKPIFVGSAMKCSPDYLIRLTTSSHRALVVGDACLADPAYHAKNPKPHIVEGYRRTIGWVVDDRVVRCHPMGGFVVYPSLGATWDELATQHEWARSVPDCTLLCPAPDPSQGEDAVRRLFNLIAAVIPDFLLPGKAVAHG